MLRPPHPVASRAEVETVLRCGPARAVPLFLPAIYEHKAAFIGSTPSAIARDGKLLGRAMLAEFEAIGPDALVVGVDVYNLEAEAVGCSVTFTRATTRASPGSSPGTTSSTWATTSPRPASRIRSRTAACLANLEAARIVRREVGADFWVRGAISGPFSLAISLVGAEAVFMACLDQPDWVRDLLAYTGRIVTTFGQAYIDAGVEFGRVRFPGRRPNCFRPRCTRNSCSPSPRRSPPGPRARACATCRS
jgi:uroporphyrinogen decarboxylase